MSAAPLKRGWLEKHSVSAPSLFKNWRRRHIALWPHSILWHRQEDGPPAGELRLEPGTKVQRDGDRSAGSAAAQFAPGSTLRIACAGRVLLLRGTAQEVRPSLCPALSAHRELPTRTMRA